MLEVRGKVGNASFTLENSSIKDNTSVNVSSTAPADIAIPLSSLLGDRCEIQMVRSHPMWKHPMNSVTPADTQASLCDNLLEYLKISEQQNCHLLLNVCIGYIQTNLCDVCDLLNCILGECGGWCVFACSWLFGNPLAGCI